MIPNLISISRIFLLVPIISFLMVGNSLFAFFLFLVGGLTDFFDGYLARYLNRESIFGANLDLLADKLFISILLIFISFHFDNLIFLIMTMLIVSRELSIGIIRQYYFQIGEDKKVKVNLLGKTKTFFQIISIGFAIILLGTDYAYIAELLVILSALVSWISLLNYLYVKN